MAKTVTARDLQAAAAADPRVQLIDVRESAEFASDGSAPGAVLAPLSNDVAAAGLLDAQKPVYILCRSGTRSQKAAALLEARGFADVRVVAGGLQAWQAAGFPVECRGPAAWSLERQVRFAVGALLLASFALGRLLHPAFHALAPLLGAGLLYSALTDTCGLAALLARLPWNRR